jgi:hypothetical protein
VNAKSYHERVAARMAASSSVGAYHSYDTILAALRQNFSEDALREKVQELERVAILMGAPPGWRYLDDGPPQRQH